MLTAKINGKEYPLRLGMMAVSAINKEYNSLSELMNVIQSKDTYASDKALFFLAYHMAVNGLAMTEKEIDIKSPSVMWALCRPQEHIPLFAIICDAIKEATDVTVEAEDADPKNAVTTQDK